MPEGTVEVILIGAQNLKDTELLGKSDPYAVITCGTQQKRSTTADDQGSHPTWNQRFNFNVDNSTASIGIRIFNENVFKDDEIGFAMIPLAKAFSEGKTAATPYPVVRPSGRPQGEVKVVLNFVPKGQPIAANVSAHGGTGYPPGQYGVYPPPGHSDNAPYPPAGDSSAHYPPHHAAYPPPAANYYGMTPSVQTPPGPQAAYPAYPPPAAVISEMHGGPEKGVKEKEKYSSAAAYGSPYPPAGYLEKPEKHGDSEKGEKHKDKDKEKEKHKEKGEKEKHQASPYPAYGGVQPAAPGHYAYPPPPNPQYGYPPAGSHNPQHGGHAYPSAPSHGMVDKHGKYKEGKHKKEGKYKHKHKGGFKFNWSFDDE